MTDFYSPVYTDSPLPHLPQLLCVSEETRAGSAYRYRGLNNPNPPHILFQYTLSGCGIFRDATDQYPVPAGIGILCESNDPEITYSCSLESTEPWRFIFMDFGGEAGYIMARELIRTYGHLYALAEGATIVERLVGFHVYDQKGCFIPASEGLQLVSDLLHALIAAKEADKNDDPERTLVRHAQRAIQAAVNRRVTASEIASHLHVSREHLTRVFKREVGLSPYQYILGCKMLMACRLLKAEGLDIQDVALAFGYDTSSHFSRAFQRIMHMTPSQFQKNGTLPTELTRRRGRLRLT